METVEFREFIRDTYSYLEQLKLRSVSSGYSMNDMPGGGGYGPKAPLNETYLTQLDEECKAVGTIAWYCIRAGSLPDIPLTGLRWSKEGACLGQHGKISDVRPVLSHMAAYAADILADDDAPWFLIERWRLVRNGVLGEDGSPKRRGTAHLVPNELEGEWLSLGKAMEYTGKSRRTIYEWVKHKSVRALDDRGEIVVQKNDLDVRVSSIADAKKARMDRLNEKRSS